MVGIAEDRREDCERSSMVEDRAEGDGRGLDGWEVCEHFISDSLSFRSMPVKQHQNQVRLQVGSLMPEKKGCEAKNSSRRSIGSDAGKTKAMSSLYFRSRKRTIDW